VRLFDLVAALDNPSHLDGKGLGIDAWADGSSAAFLPNGLLAVDLVGIEEIDGEASDARNEALRLFDPAQPGTPTVIGRAGRVGTMMGVGMHHLLGLYEHPKLIDLRTGEVERTWPDINCGTQTSSILINGNPIPPIALDNHGQRCAIADSEGINVLEFLPSASGQCH
jgi:hypothetical protein